MSSGTGLNTCPRPVHVFSRTDHCRCGRAAVKSHSTSPSQLCAISRPRPQTCATSWPSAPPTLQSPAQPIRCLNDPNKEFPRPNLSKPTPRNDELPQPRPDATPPHSPPHSPLQEPQNRPKTAPQSENISIPPPYSFRVGGQTLKADARGAGRGGRGGRGGR
jgi:hypothetical protein